MWMEWAKLRTNACWHFVWIENTLINYRSYWVSYIDMSIVSLCGFIILLLNLSKLGMIQSKMIELNIFTEEEWSLCQPHILQKTSVQSKMLTFHFSNYENHKHGNVRRSYRNTIIAKRSQNKQLPKRRLFKSKHAAFSYSEPFHVWTNSL